jgi:IS605 OrfB family transposase
MFLTQTNVIRGLTKAEYAMLGEMCRYSNNLYNVALYNIRQHYFNTKQFLKYESNYHECKTNENYGLLQAGISQQILRVADRSFKSFFNLVKKAKSGDYRFCDIRMPHYRKKGGMFVLVLSTNAITVKDGYFIIPQSREFSKLHNGKNIRIPFPERLAGRTIKEVRILPVNNGQYYKIQYVYVQDEEPQLLDTSKALGIDLGIDNLATCVPANGTPFIIDGRKIKSINQYWNKQKAYYQAIADRQNIKGGKTRRIHSLTLKRNNQVRDVIRKAARYIINYCMEYNIGAVVVGYNEDFKRYSNLGKQNNQNFIQMPLGDLRQSLQYLCQRYGILYIEQEESYTSKASYLDDDTIPVYKAEQPYTGTFSGKRIYRGLYMSANGSVINADVNGACNILKKVSGYSFELPSSGCLAHPLRISFS